MVLECLGERKFAGGLVRLDRVGQCVGPAANGSGGRDPVTRVVVFDEEFAKCGTVGLAVSHSSPKAESLWVLHGYTVNGRHMRHEDLDCRWLGDVGDASVMFFGGLDHPLSRTFRRGHTRVKGERGKQVRSTYAHETSLRKDTSQSCEDVDMLESFDEHTCPFTNRRHTLGFCVTEKGGDNGVVDRGQNALQRPTFHEVLTSGRTIVGDHSAHRTIIAVAEWLDEIDGDLKIRHLMCLDVERIAIGANRADHWEVTEKLDIVTGGPLGGLVISRFLVENRHGLTGECLMHVRRIEWSWSILGLGDIGNGDVRTSSRVSTASWVMLLPLGNDLSNDFYRLLGRVTPIDDLE